MADITLEQVQAHLERRFAERDEMHLRETARVLELCNIKISAHEEHAETRIAAQREYYETRLDALEKSIGVAEGLMDKRLEGMNEIRSQLSAQAQEFATKGELDGHINVINVKLDSLTKSRDEAKGKASQTSMLIAIGFSVVSVIFGMASLILAGISIAMKLFGGI